MPILSPLLNDLDHYLNLSTDNYRHVPRNIYNKLQRLERKRLKPLCPNVNGRIYIGTDMSPDETILRARILCREDSSNLNTEYRFDDSNNITKASNFGYDNPTRLPLRKPPRARVNMILGSSSSSRGLNSSSSSSSQNNTNSGAPSSSSNKRKIPIKQEDEDSDENSVETAWQPEDLTLRGIGSIIPQDGKITGSPLPHSGSAVAHFSVEVGQPDMLRWAASLVDEFEIVIKPINRSERASRWNEILPLLQRHDHRVLPRIFCIDGLIGAGKTELLIELDTRIRARGLQYLKIVPEARHEWNQYRDIDNGHNDTLINHYYRNPQKYAFMFQLMVHM